jgi:hypothetical protein
LGKFANKMRTRRGGKEFSVVRHGTNCAASGRAAKAAKRIASKDSFPGTKIQPVRRAEGVVAAPFFRLRSRPRGPSAALIRCNAENLLHRPVHTKRALAELRCSSGLRGGS